MSARSDCRKWLRALFSMRCCLLRRSILITYASDYIGKTLGLGTTLAGALLLGIVTSLPEMISCFVLARIGNFNAWWATLSARICSIL